MTKIILLILVTAAIMGNVAGRPEWKLTCGGGKFAACLGYCSCEPNGRVVCLPTGIPQLTLLGVNCCSAAATGCVNNANCACDLIDRQCSLPGRRCKLTEQDYNALWIDTETGTKYCRHHETGDAAGIYTGSCLQYLDGERHTLIY